MKRLLLTVVMAVAAIAMYALTEDGVDVLYLNNGTVLKGHVESVEENVKVTFVTEDGKSYTYPMIEVRRIDRNSEVVTPSTTPTGYVDYRKRQSRFFFAAELQGAYAITPRTPVGFATDVNVVAGYRVNEYFRVGVGVGARYYINGGDFRSAKLSSDWACPLFVNFRGNIISEEYRDAVPFYSLDAGFTIGDNGLMIRPTLGYRFGVSHSAFLLGISYWGQISDKEYLSFVGIKLGYEF